MDYKYKKNQLFGKRLKVPKHILQKVYNCTLTFEEYIEYELEDKIPISCINYSDRIIVERFGTEKCRELDWEFINQHLYYYRSNPRDKLLSINPNEEDINHALYELLINEVKPIDYTPKMKERYPDRYFDTSTIENKEQKNLAIIYNEGKLNIKDIITNWDLFKDKNLSFCLKHDSYNRETKITEKELRDFIEHYQSLTPLILNYGNIYEFISDISNLESPEEKQSHIKEFTDRLIEKSSQRGQFVFLGNDDYKEIFKYSSLEDLLTKYHYGYTPEKIIEELKTLPEDYLYTMPFDISVLFNSNVISFINTYGLKNIVDFDLECGHFFSKDDCEMLKLMNDMYLHYAVNEHDPNKTIYTRQLYDEEGNYVDRPYTKDEFYEAMRRMIIYGPSDSNYRDKAPDYRTMTGEFRRRNQELFIDENAPEELQKLFYTKSITIPIIREHREYIDYLEGKDLSSCFKPLEIEVNGSNTLSSYENLYSFITSKTDYRKAMDYLIEYSDILDIVFNRGMPNYYLYEIRFNKDDDMSRVKRRINDSFRKMIVERRIPYPEHIPNELKELYPTMFLSEDAPTELQERFYTRTIDIDFILSNNEYMNYLKEVDLNILFRNMPVKYLQEKRTDTKRILELSPLRGHKENIIDILEKELGRDETIVIMLSYGKYIEKIYDINSLDNLSLEKGFTKEELLTELDRVIYQAIINNNLKYNEDLPDHFKKNYPTLFLNENISQDIKDKFYNRRFTLNDFNKDSNLLDIFTNTNIACGFSENMSWIIPLFEKEDIQIANLNRLKVIAAYTKIQDVALQKEFKDYVTEHVSTIDIEKIDYISEVLRRLSLSNSSEIFAFRKELAKQILASDDPIESLNKIEDTFVRNNIPTVGKVYSCFEILHPDFRGFNFDYSNISPVLKQSSTRSKKLTVFTDLVKASFGSNNKSVNSYLHNIEVAANIYKRIKKEEVKYEELTEEEQQELITFSKHLATLYNNTMRAKLNSITFSSCGDVIEDIKQLEVLLSPDGTTDYKIEDRIIRMFCGHAGISTLEQAQSYIKTKIETADSRNRDAARSDLVLAQGDFIKGIGDITYLRNILQNGSVSKEFLGSSADSDATPLDTDVSMIQTDGTISEQISSTVASSYGPIYFVLKHDDRFQLTRTDQEELEFKRDPSKLEVFYTGVLGRGHYGIRTGFASSDINYIIMNNYDTRVGLEIAMNGFYIPIANKEGKIIFTPEMYDALREKMNGLSYYGEEEYHFSPNLKTTEVEEISREIEKSNREVQEKRRKINKVIKEALEELGLQLKTQIDGDLSEGYVELIDTGSTGRGTNKPGDGDFDFMMRLDKTIISDPTKLSKLKETILKKLNRDNNNGVIGTGDFRLKGVELDEETKVDIDITFTEKTDKILYSTDMALQDRLETIKKTDPEKYRYVVANILLAKKVLKEAGVYKPCRGENPQGGLGGVGIENWILQHGGSFIDAANSFVEASHNKDFESFKKEYQIWDFGENHLAERRGLYPHDNFVANNMSEAGYNKMVIALEEYLKRLKKDHIDVNELSI